MIAEIQIQIQIQILMFTREHMVKITGLCYQERPSGQDVMSSTNGISNGPPLWLKEPDLSSPTQADHLV